MTSIGSQTEYAVVALCYAVVTYILWSVLEPWTGLETVLNIDNRNYHPDMIAYGVERLFNADFPLWNPHQAAGVPFFATLQGMLLYPPSWLAALFSVDSVHLFSKYLHMLITSLSVYFYLRVLKLHPLASFLAGLFASTGNFYLAFTLAVTATYPLATLGILLGATEKILRASPGAMDRSAYRWSLVLIVLLTLQTFAGYIQSAVFSSYVLCLYVLFRITQLYWAERRVDIALSRLIRFGVMALFTVMLASIQLLPTFEMSTYSLTHNLQKGMDMSAVNLAVFPPLSFSETLDDAVVPMTRSSWDMMFWGFIVFGLIAAKRFLPLMVFFLFLSLLFLTLARGSEGGLYALYYLYVPTGNWFRWPEKFLLLSNFSLSVLVGLGLHGCHQFLRHRNWRLASGAVWTYCFAIFSVAFLARYSSLGVQIEPPDWHWDALGKAHTPYHSSDLGAKALDLLKHPAQFRFEPELTYDDARPALNFLKQYPTTERILPLLIIDWAKIPDLSAKWATREKLYSIDDYEPMISARFREYAKAMRASPLFLRNVPGNLKMMSLFSVRWVLVSQNWIDSNPGKLPRGIRQAYSDSRFAVYEFPRVVPRSYLARNIVHLPEDDILPYLASKKFEPFSQVVVNSTSGSKPQPSKEPVLPATITKYEPESVVIELPKDGQGGILVLTDQYDPNWRATVDGEKAEIIPVNYLFRGVAVPPGSRRVVFSYAPDYFYWGVFISLSGLLLLLAIQVRIVYQNRLFA